MKERKRSKATWLVLCQNFQNRSSRIRAPRSRNCSTSSFWQWHINQARYSLSRISQAAANTPFGTTLHPDQDVKNDQYNRLYFLGNSDQDLINREEIMIVLRDEECMPNWTRPQASRELVQAFHGRNGT